MANWLVMRLNSQVSIQTGGVNPQDWSLGVNSNQWQGGESLSLDFPVLLLSHKLDSLLISLSSNQ